ncbi:MAG TPA: hypothetical protein VMG98_03600 [Verrucomicrobiae bacterium]|nr:hypothetical protein [Verrucomicrobiae bacterium]
MITAIIAALTMLMGQASVQPAPSPSVTPDVPVYVGNPATHFTVEERVEGFDPDGDARLLLVAHFFDAQNQPTRILANSDLDWMADRGQVQWQNRMRYGSPAAIVLVNTDGPIVATIHANMPALGTVVVHSDTRTWTGQRVVAKALGPRMVQIGWFPRATAPVRVVRIDARKRRVPIATLPPGSSTYRDATVQTGAHYEYVVTQGNRVAQLAVSVPGPLLATSIDDAAGKGMWLYWSLNPLDDNYYAKLDPNAIVEQAVKAGLHYVELRTAYGAQWLIPAAAKPTIDAIIDGLAARGIVPVGWTVPREVTFEDLSASMRTIDYRTARGTPLRGIALDLERGGDFLGGDPHGLAALWTYEYYLREAVGPRYLIVATVEDPALEHLDNTTYPFREIARYADVLQPMTYWRMLARQANFSPDVVREFMRRSYRTALEQAGRTMPVSIGGETAPDDRNGYPPAAEISASLDASKAAGAIGVCFFDWSGTRSYQWNAIGAFPWTLK